MSAELRDHRGLIEPPVRERFDFYAHPYAAFELATTAYNLRLRLARYADRFEVHVSDDTRQAAMCKECGMFVHGAREDFRQIERKMLDHKCKGRRNR